MAEGFTYAVDEKYRSACKDVPKYPGTQYCVLHYPGEEKNKEDFEEEKRASLTGKTTILAAQSFPKVLQSSKGTNSMGKRISLEQPSLET